MKKIYLGLLGLPLIALCACSFPYNDVTCEGEHIKKEFNLGNSEKLECENIKLKDESKCKINLHEGDSKKVVIDFSGASVGHLNVTGYTKGNLSGASYLYLSGSGRENVSTSGDSIVSIK